MFRAGFEPWLFRPRRRHALIDPVAGLAVIAEDVHRTEVKGLDGAKGDSASGEPWRRGCRVDVVHIVQIIHTSVHHRPFGQVGGRPVSDVADGGISSMVGFSYRNVGRQGSREDGLVGSGSCGRYGGRRARTT